MTLLLPTSRADGENPLDKAVPLGAVRAETALAPDHGTTKCLFGPIVGWLDPLFAHERPERILVPEQFLTHPLGRMTAPRPLREEHVDRRLDWGHGRLQRLPTDRPFAVQMPQPKHDPAQRQEARAPHSQSPTSVSECLKVTDQMRPAQLVSHRIERQIWFMAIRGDNSSIGRSDQVAQGWS